MLQLPLHCINNNRDETKTGNTEQTASCIFFLWLISSYTSKILWKRVLHEKLMLFIYYSLHSFALYMFRYYIENTSLTSVTTTATIFKRALSLFVPIPLGVLTLHKTCIKQDQLQVRRKFMNENVQKKNHRI